MPKLIGPPCYTPTGLRLRYNPIAPSPKQAAFLALTCPEALYGGAAGGGKALALDTLIPTPAGWAAMGDIHVGDLIFGRDGNAHTVLAESAVEVLPGWRFTFDDGAVVECTDEHLWLTFTAAERSAKTRRTAEYRDRRRAGRPSRSAVGAGTRVAHTAQHRAALSARLTAWNRNNPPPTLAAPGGTVRTAADVAATLMQRGRTNHSVPLAAPLDLPERVLPLDPYILGVWLGDGTTRAGVVTTMDEEVIAAVAAVYPERRRNPKGRAWAVAFDGLWAALRQAGVAGDKHVPHAYLWGSLRQRRALLAGLLDSDGTATVSGAAEFTNTNRGLAEAVAHLVRSLGMKAAVREGRARLDGRDCGPKWTVKFTPGEQVFRLSRKGDRLHLAPRASTHSRYIVGAERLSAIAAKCIRTSAADGLFLATRHMIPTHNSAALLMSALQFADVPGYNALLLRRTLADLKLPDSLIPLSKWMIGDRATWNANDYKWTFPSTAVLQFGYLRSPGDELRYQSAQFAFIGVDELTQFPDEDQIRYMFSRLRRPKLSREGMLAHFGPSPDGLTLADVPLRFRAATNPGGPGHVWVRRRYVDPESAEAPFLPSRLEDNPGLDHAEYRRSLTYLSEVERRRLELGDWEVVEVPGALWSFADIVHEDPPETFDTVVVGVDGAVSEGTGDECGIVAAGVAGGKVWILADESLRSHPDVWAKKAVTVFHGEQASRIVVEANQGGEMNRTVVHNAADILGVPRPRVVLVNAVKSKELRAQPVAQAYRAGKVVHHPSLKGGTLEAHMCSWVPGSNMSLKSPDRIDALVWAVTDILFGAAPRATAARSRLSSWGGDSVPRPTVMT